MSFGSFRKALSANDSMKTFRVFTAPHIRLVGESVEGLLAADFTKRSCVSPMTMVSPPASSAGCFSRRPFTEVPEVDPGSWMMNRPP